MAKLIRDMGEHELKEKLTIAEATLVLIAAAIGPSGLEYIQTQRSRAVDVIARAKEKRESRIEAFATEEAMRNQDIRPSYRRGNDDAMHNRSPEPGTPEYDWIHRWVSPDNQRDSMG